MTFGANQFVENPGPTIRFKYIEIFSWMLGEFAPLKSKHDSEVVNAVKQSFLHCHCEPKARQSFQLHNNGLPRRYTPRNDDNTSHSHFLLWTSVHSQKIQYTYSIFLKRIHHTGCSTNWLSPKVKHDCNVCGRSMIEMLGVLTIVGVLSVGGIAGYSKAMEKYKLNKAISEYSYFIFSMYEHADTFKKLPKGTGLASLANQLNFFPASWRLFSDYGDRWAIDGLGNKISMWRTEAETDSYLVFEIYLPRDENAKKLDMCRSLLKDFIQPLHKFARHAYVWRNEPEITDVHWYGKDFCGAERKCLKDVTLTEIDTACRSCVDSKGSCSLVLTY